MRVLGLLEWDGRRVIMYHYHASAEFPYTVSYFKGRQCACRTPAAVSRPPTKR